MGIYEEGRTGERVKRQTGDVEVRGAVTTVQAVSVDHE